jgi:phage terminase large subunit
VRMVIPRCWFDTQKCARGLDALKLYRADYDTALRALRPHPIHDWTSHAADAFRYLAMTLDGRVGQGGFNRRIEYGQPALP